MAEDFDEKTEAPTQRRLAEAREEGNVTRSTDLMSGVALLGAVLLLWPFSSLMLESAATMIATLLGGNYSADTVDPTDAMSTILYSMAHGLWMFAPVAVGTMIVTIAAGLLQVGFLYSTKAIAPKPSKLSPINGFKQIVSLRGLVKLGMSVLKVAIVVVVAGWSVMVDLPKVLMLLRFEAEGLLGHMSSIIWWLGVKVALVLLLLGILDYLYLRWQREQDLKMSKQDIKEEMKRMEGDPLIKSQRAKFARQLMLQRIQSDVPKADVVVSNPTHFAIALKYDKEMTAPRVIAKGADYLAIRIRQVATAHGVPIVERPPLARAMFKSVEVGQEIPPQFYTAVAEILAYVYRLAGKKSA